MRIARHGYCSPLVFALSFLVAFEPVLPAGSSPKNAARSSDPVVTVNRKLPRFEPASTELMFSRLPSDDEIARARVLPGPLLPLGAAGISARSENRALANALVDYHRRQIAEDVRPLTRFLDAHPHSRYQAALLVNLGALYKEQGRISRAFPALARAWSLTKDGVDRDSMAVANWALGEAAGMHAHLDPVTRAQLDDILDGLGPRDLHGPTTESVRLALAGRAMRERHPEEAFRCGPVSLAMLREYLHLPREVGIERAPGSAQGFSLAGLEKLAVQYGMQMRAIRVEPGARVPVPSVIHWKYDHYSAVLERKQEGGREYFRVQNPLLDRDHWMSREAVEEEASGYYLVPNDEMQAGWVAAGKEAANIWGRCEFAIPALDQEMDWALEALCRGGGLGMPKYNFQLALAGLTVTDTPLSYKPPIGPAVQFRITYHQRDAFQQAVPNYSNLGPKWTFSWLSYIGGLAPSEIPLRLTGAGDSGRVYLRNGGVEQYATTKAISTPALFTRDYGNQFQSHAHLLLYTPLRVGSTPAAPEYYERQLADGSKEIYGQTNSGQQVYFLTQIVDPQGNAIKFTYDSRMRIVAVTDAIGQVTTLTYGLSSDQYKITKVTDPFGRSATLTYDFNNHLSQITDVMGFTSTFTYGANDFITTMTTPYGETTFQTGHGSNDSTPDPSYAIHAAKYPTAADDPMNVFVQATDPNGDTERVEFCNFISKLPQRDDWNDSLNSGGTLPVPYLNTRMSFYWDKNAWKQYPGDYTKAKAYRWLDSQVLGTQSGVLDYIQNPLEGRVVFHYPGQTKPFYQVGTSVSPSAILRLLEDGRTQQVKAIESNDSGRITKYTDPLGRQVTILYDFNGIDPLEIRNPATNELLAKFSYSKPHQPASYTDAGGQVTNYSYNSAGQLVSVTDAKQQTTRYTYDTRGYLTTITGPLPSALTRFSYDAYGRVQTVTDSEGYTAGYSYDALDRITRITYPDKTTYQVTYDKLDPVAFTDRQGRTGKIADDVLRRPVSMTDPLGRTTTLGWCSCGALVSLTDPNGNTTTWNRDIQNRVTSKVLADGSTTQYSYDRMTGRLAQVTSPNGQVTSFNYFPDGDLQQVSFSGTGSPLAPVIFSYDQNYNRATGFTDATGTTTTSYRRAGSPGGLQVASVTGPSGTTVNYSYDELGRPATRTIDGSTAATAYDQLGRTISQTNPLGRFGFTYLGATGKVQSATYPNGQSTLFSYFDNSGDQRLKQIVNQGPNKSVLSQFGYTYLPTGEIRSLSAAQGVYSFAYDAAGQLTGVETDGQSAFAYTYDAVGNRTGEQIGADVNWAQYDSANQMTQGSAGQFTYDPNGNLLSDGSRTFEWDGLNRLTAINVDTHRSEFNYDALGRRTHMVEKDAGTAVSDKELIWCGRSICEERDSVTGINKRFFAQGETRISGGVETAYFYTRDRLGSIREMTDSNGTVVASYDYDPWGRSIKLSGDMDASFGYAGYYVHQPSHLYLMQYRAYDPNLGRWLSRDPLGEAGGLNPYGYAGNMPVNATDPSGLELLQGSVSMDVAGDSSGGCPDDSITFSIPPAFGIFVPGLQNLANIINFLSTYHPVETAYVGLAFAGGAVAAAPAAGAAGAAGSVETGLLTADGSTTISAAETLPGAADDFVSVYHGSIDNGPAILENGLDPTRGATFATRDLAAARNALQARPEAVPGLGQIIESRIPTGEFENVLAPVERPYSGFYPYGLNSSEITLRTPEQFQLFNQYILK